MPDQPIFRRDFPLATSSGLVPVIDEKKRTARLSFSSEEPYRQPQGPYPKLLERISHDEGCGDLSRLNSGVGPLLLNHDPHRQIGLVERAWIEGGRGYAIRPLWHLAPRRRSLAGREERRASRGQLFL